MNSDLLFKLISLIEQDKITELEAERLMNAATRLDTGTPTGGTRIPDKQRTHTH